MNISYSLVHATNAHNCQDYARVKPGTDNSIQVFHTSQDAYKQEAGVQGRAGTWTQELQYEKQSSWAET